MGIFEEVRKRDAQARLEQLHAAQSDDVCLWFNAVSKYCDAETREKIYNAVGWYKDGRR